MEPAIWCCFMLPTDGQLPDREVTDNIGSLLDRAGSILRVSILTIALLLATKNNREPILATANDDNL
jgi:hypothetical protein